MKNSSSFLSKTALISIIISICLFFFCAKENVFSAPPCRGPLPEYVEEFKKHYLEVDIVADDCYPTFSFVTPSAYSKFSFKYNNSIFHFPLTETFEEFDKKVREQIVQFETLAAVREYYDLIKEDREYLEIIKSNAIDVAFAWFLRNKETKDAIMQTTSYELKLRKILNPFLSEHHLDDYTKCRWLRISNYPLSKDDYNVIKGVVISDTLCFNGKKERLVFVLENGSIKEAYFFAQDGKQNRKFFP